MKSKFRVELIMFYALINLSEDPKPSKFSINPEITRHLFCA